MRSFRNNKERNKGHMVIFIDDGKGDCRYQCKQHESRIKVIIREYANVVPGCAAVERTVVRLFPGHPQRNIPVSIVFNLLQQ